MNASTINTSTSDCVLGDLIERSGAFDPKIALKIYRYGYTNKEGIAVSVIVPVHNQDRVIESNLQSVRRNLSQPHEFIVVVDGCTDGTEHVVQRWAAMSSDGPITCGVTVVVVVEGVFETICDAIGARIASGEYLLEVQADMYICENGFDRVMLGALRVLPELIAVGGRGAHSFRLATPSARRTMRDIAGRVSREVISTGVRATRQYRPTLAELRFSDSIGRVGDLIECSLLIPENARKVFVHETIMRGPLAIRREEFLSMGGFDTERFFLGNDDHDFAVRALVHHQRRVGYVPIGFDSPVAVGTTRAPRTPQAEAKFRLLRSFYEARFGESELARQAGRIHSPLRYAADIPFEA